MLTRRRHHTIRRCASCWRPSARHHCQDCEIQRVALVNLQCLLHIPRWLIESLWDSSWQEPVGVSRDADMRW